MQLGKIQARFKDTMLGHPDAINNTAGDFAALFEEGDIPLPERLKVYRNNIVGGLTETLVVSFPMIEKLVGRDFFEGMARSYVLEHPPRRGNLNTYGDRLAAFIENFEPAKPLPYLTDIARFEAAMTASYYAPDDTALSAKELQNIPADDLSTLILVPRQSVILMKSPYPLDDIRSFCMAEEQDENATLDLDKGGVEIMIYRPELEVLVVKLENGELQMLQSLKEGLSLGDALEETLKHMPDFNFSEFLEKHIHLETFCALGSNS